MHVQPAQRDEEWIALQGASQLSNEEMPEACVCSSTRAAS